MVEESAPILIDVEDIFFVDFWLIDGAAGGRIWTKLFGTKMRNEHVGVEGSVLPFNEDDAVGVRRE